MKIAMVGLKGIPATYGGVERHVEELGARLVQRGHSVVVYCRRHYTSQSGEHRGMKLRVFPSMNTKHLDTFSHMFLSVTDALCHDYDLVHFHSIGPALFSFVPRVFRPGCAVVCTVHAEDWRRRKWGRVARWWLRRGEWAANRFPHRTIAVSRGLAEKLSQHHPVAYVPNGVPFAQVEPLDELKSLGLEEGRYLLWLGRFVPEKRVEDLVAAFRALPGDYKLLLGGELDESDSYLRSVRAVAAGDARILFAGGLYGKRKAEALSHAALFVTPSDLEGFPIALLEAMRYGRTVLASDIPEHLEAVRDTVNGFTFRAGGANSLAERMRWILSNPAAAAAAGRQAAQDAGQYDWDRIVEQTESVYRGALSAVL